jgi:recombinational DNA repair ATPase RecF
MSPRRQLEHSIEHLRKELAEGEPLTVEDRQLLERTLEEVAAELDESHEDDSMTDTLYEELQELAERVEKSRPNLALILGRIVDSLSQLGM